MRYIPEFANRRLALRDEATDCVRRGAVGAYRDGRECGRGGRRALRNERNGARGGAREHVGDCLGRNKHLVGQGFVR
jgi:hypothetical protein